MTDNSNNGVGAPAPAASEADATATNNLGTPPTSGPASTEHQVQDHTPGQDDPVDTTLETAAATSTTPETQPQQDQHSETDVMGQLQALLDSMEVTRRMHQEHMQSRQQRQQELQQEMRASTEAASKPYLKTPGKKTLTGRLQSEDEVGIPGTYYTDMHGGFFVSDEEAERMKEDFRRMRESAKNVPRSG